MSSAFGGFAPDPHRGVLLLDPAGDFVLQTPHCPPGEKSCGRLCPQACTFISFSRL